MQVEVDLKCMQTNFGGCGLSGFGDFAHFCLPQNGTEKHAYVGVILALCVGQNIPFTIHLPSGSKCDFCLSC